MRVTFHATEDEAKSARAFFAQYAKTPFVVRRKRRNLEGPRRAVKRGRFWKALVDCLLTTQQRSGPSTPVTRFMRLRPYPVSLATMRRRDNVQRYVEQELSTAGLRRWKTLAREIGVNLHYLEEGGWEEILPAVNRLVSTHSRTDERQVAQLLAARLKGVGPKQSRNVLQVLGLTRFETPIDSRITKWLKRFGFPLKVTPQALADAKYYELVADGLTELCRAARIAPCLMDAAIFQSFDKGWNRRNMVW